MLLLSLFHLVTIAFFLKRHFELLTGGSRTPNNWSYAALTALGAGSALVLLMGVLGIFNEPGHSLYRVGVSASLLMSAIGFVSVVRFRDEPAA
jgi:hypothetical protein